MNDINNYQNQNLYGEVPEKKPAPMLFVLFGLGYFLAYNVIRNFIAETVFLYYYGATGMDEMKAYELYYEKANMLSVFSGLIILAMLTVFFSVRKKKLTNALCIKKTRFGLLTICFFLGISLNFTTNLVLSLLPAGVLGDYTESASQMSNGPMVWYILAAVVVAPIIEEVVFRSLILARFSRATGNMIAILLSSLIFGLVHGQIVWICYAATLGLVLGVIFVRTRSLLACIVTHMGYNLVSLLSYIDVEKMSQSVRMIYEIVNTLVFSLAVPLAIALFLVFVHESSDSAKKEAVGSEL